MSKIMITIKKSLLCFMALVTSASMLPPVSAYATETESEVSVDNHTEGREKAKTVSGITIGDVTAPQEGMRLDDTAVVTTAENETWEIPVIWIGEDLKPDTGLAGKGTYIPVLAYVVPPEYTVMSDDISGRGYKITLSKDLLELFGEAKIISIYENKTGITYILPAKIKDLFAQKGSVKYPTDEGGNVIIPAEDVHDPEQNKEETKEEEEEKKEEEEEKKEEEEEKKEEEEEKKEEDQFSRIVNVHCDNNAKNALSNEDLEFLTNLVINTLEPQAVNLLLEKFPAFKNAAEIGAIGKYLAVVISYEEGSDTVGAATRGYTDDTKYPDNTFCYNFTLNASSLVEKSGDNTVSVIRDTSSTAFTDLANTITHELFHVFTYDYNRPGLTGRRYVDGTLLDVSSDVQFPVWFVEGSASSVENDWQYRQEALKMLRTPTNAQAPLQDFDKNLLLDRYANGRYTRGEDGQLICDYNFDIEFCNGTDRYGNQCSSTPSCYVSGYLANMYLCELAARHAPGVGSSKTTVDGKTVISSENLRKGMNFIMESMHNGRTLDDVITTISNGAYVNTHDFEERFIKGTMDDNEQYVGESDSLNFVYDFVSYMNEIDKAKENGERSYLANGSLLFDFDKDYCSPLSFDTTATSSVLQPLDDEDGDFTEFARSSVRESYASSTGGKSLSGNRTSTSDSSGSGSSKVIAFSNEETSLQEAAKDSNTSSIAATTEAVITSDAAPAAEEDATAEDSEAADEGSAVETAVSEDNAAASVETTAEDATVEAPAQAASEEPSEPAPATQAEEAAPAQTSEAAETAAPAEETEYSSAQQ